MTKDVFTRILAAILFGLLIAITYLFDFYPGWIMNRMIFPFNAFAVLYMIVGWVSFLVWAICYIVDCISSTIDKLPD